MARKRALVVDDSKSARVILSRMLEKYDIEVDMAESAEQALDYLTRHRPDAIFMDHQMPGMDGLQAVQAIKSNPDTAMIPIMMYTSQEGELYVGQARALGAMGVLPKQVRPVDVSKVLYELHLLPDRRDLAEPALQPVELDNGTVTAIRPVVVAAAAAPLPEWSRRLEGSMRDQSADLRRFIVASLDGFSTRIVSDVRDALPPKPVEQLPLPVPPPAPAKGPWLGAVAAAAAAALAFAALWIGARNDLARSRAEVAGLTAANAELAHARQDLAETVKDLTSALTVPVGAQPASPVAPASLPSMLSEAVPYGEIPLDRSRLEVLRELVGKLQAQGFRGAIKVTSSAGAFCLTGSAADGYVPASPGLPLSKCDTVGNPFEESLAGQPRQSLAFANLVAGIRTRTQGAITVSLENSASPRGAVPYPPRTDSVTAGEWNRAAAANNRVDFAVEPGPP
jgi:CheY-like chemotaxis protein